MKVEDGLVGIADTRVTSGSECITAKKVSLYQYQGSAMFLMTSGLRSARDKAGPVHDATLDLFAIDDVLVTHVHGDHMNGLEGFAFYKRFVEGKRVRLVASPEVRAAIWDERLKAPMSALWDGARFQTLGFDDYFEHVPLDWASPITVGPFRIRARRTIHHVPTSALLVEAAGRTLGYSSDTAFDPELIEFLSPADLIIHETNFGPAHTPYAALAGLPADLRTRMRLIHYSDLFDASSSAIAVVREGEVLHP